MTSPRNDPSFTVNEVIRNLEAPEPQPDAHDIAQRAKKIRDTFWSGFWPVKTGQHDDIADNFSNPNDATDTRHNADEPCLDCDPDSDCCPASPLADLHTNATHWPHPGALAITPSQGPTHATAILDAVSVQLCTLTDIMQTDVQAGYSRQFMHLISNMHLAGCIVADALDTHTETPADPTCSYDPIPARIIEALEDAIDRTAQAVEKLRQDARSAAIRDTMDHDFMMNVSRDPATIRHSLAATTGYVIRANAEAIRHCRQQMVNNPEPRAREAYRDAIFVLQANSIDTIDDSYEGHPNAMAPNSSVFNDPPLVHPDSDDPNVHLATLTTNQIVAEAKAFQMEAVQTSFTPSLARLLRTARSHEQIPMPHTSSIHCGSLETHQHHAPAHYVSYIHRNTHHAHLIDEPFAAGYPATLAIRSLIDIIREFPLASQTAYRAFILAMLNFHTFSPEDAQRFLTTLDESGISPGAADHLFAHVDFAYPDLNASGETAMSALRHRAQRDTSPVSAQQASAIVIAAREAGIDEDVISSMLEGLDQQPTDLMVARTPIKSKAAESIVRSVTQAGSPPAMVDEIIDVLELVHDLDLDYLRQYE